MANVEPSCADQLRNFPNAVNLTAGVGCAQMKGDVGSTLVASSDDVCAIFRRKRMVSAENLYAQTPLSKRIINDASHRAIGQLAGGDSQSGD